MNAFAAASAALLILLSACTRNAGQDTAANQGFALKKGSPIFGFDHEAVGEVLIVKADPGSGDRWSARLRRQASAHSADPVWEIQSATDVPAPLDRRADGGLVVHLLDTLRTLRALETSAPQGPLDSLGLQKPRFALTWKAGERTFELLVGGPAREPGSAYALVPGHPPFVVDGAALKMLDYLDSFAALRLKTWAGVSADDIDEIQLARRGKRAYYAQREGSDWTDRKHKRLAGDVSAHLQGLAHARVLRFVDDPDEAARGRERLSTGFVHEAILTDRHAHSVTLRAARAAGTAGKWIASSSARPDGVFEIYPEAVRFFEPPRE